ncbi:MAG: hypothetical protein ACYC6L_13460, partial [Anaerolineae bacterium]
FGYVGYEAPCGNFIYTAYAAPTSAVMSGYNYIDGWIAKGTDWPSVAVSGPEGMIKQASQLVVPRLLWLSNDKLYINTYWNTATSVYIEPGDTVTIVSGNLVHSITVDNLSARLYAEQEIVAGIAPAAASLRIVPEKDRAAWKQVTASPSGGYAATNPYQTRSSSNCNMTTKDVNLVFGDYGRVYLQHADGNEVFITFYNRMLRIFDNANIVRVSGFPMRALDWTDILPVGTPTVTVKYTPKPGQTGAGTGTINLPVVGWTSDILLKLDSNPAVGALIRAGGSIEATYQEGALGMTRPVTLTLNPLPLEFGIWVSDEDTVAAIGPVHWQGPDSAVLVQHGTIDWVGKATLLSPAVSTPFPYSGSVAYPPVQFIRSGSVVPLVPGSTGTISFVDPLGNEVYTTWGVTDNPYIVKIRQPLRHGDTLVCGTVKPPEGLPASVVVNLHDVTDNEDVLFASGMSDSAGWFCIEVNPPLYMGQVLLGEVNGFRSQLVIVGPPPRAWLPLVTR